MDINKHDIKRFLVKSSDLTRKKLFVEFYQPKFQFLFKKLHECPYPLHLLKKLSNRMFDGPFGSNRKVDMYQDSGIPYIRVKDVLPLGIFLDGLKYISQEKHNELIRSRVVTGNILITIAGRVGTAAVFPESLKEGNITGHIVGLELLKEINPHYVATFINSQLGEFQAIRLGHRTTRPELNLSEVGEFIIPIPPRPVQDHIAQIMQDAYAIQKNKLSEAQPLYQAINQYILGELGIDITKLKNHNRVIKSIRSIAGGRFDFEAVVTLQEINLGLMKPVLLREVVKQVNQRITPVNEYANENINYIGLGNIASNTGELVDFFPVQGEEILSSSPKFEVGDILFGRMRPYLNKVWLAEFNGVCSGEAVVLRPNKQKVDPIFLQGLLLSQITLNQVVPLQSGTSLPRVSASDILNIKLPIPEDLNKQRKISAEISRRCAESKKLRVEAENLVTEAKARVERMILGVEEVT
ncbi:MAG: restriction endonuclease subunit S [Nostoc sp.]|uniref:restriction endonuclease subunit S n=1 Tax=Nostoc sp. TaxID=1180 RepID=UPI002FF76FB6